MKKYLIVIVSVFEITLSYNCRKEVPLPSEPSPVEVRLNLPAKAYDYTIRHSVIYENNKWVDNIKATVGRVLFYDKALSVNNKVSCASCHQQENAFSDVKAFSTGFQGELTSRNAMSIVNLQDEIDIGYFWDGRERKIENMVFDPIQNHIEMGFEDIELITQKLYMLPYYRKLFKESFGSEQVTTELMRECLGNFVFSIVSYESKLDRYVTNFKPPYLDSSELRGIELFKSNKCNACHFISKSFSTSQYYGIKFTNIGLDEKDADEGRNGQFKIPRLRNITKTAPYMHDGRFKTLEEVLEHYSHNIKHNARLDPALLEGGSPKQYNFSEQDKADLIAFLKLLDDHVVTTDVRFSSPFIN